MATSMNGPCRGHTSACLGSPTKPYGHGLLRREPVALCDACAAVLRAMGMDLRDERRAVEIRVAA